MIIVYSLIDGQLEVNSNFQGTALPKEAVWIDLYNPSIEEEVFVEKQLNINVPTRKEMKKIEVMSRSYQEGDAYYMTASLFKMAENNRGINDGVSFILTKEHLITLRYFDPKSFSIFSDYAKAHPYVCLSSDTVFEGLVESVINRLADVLDIVGEDADKISAKIFTIPKKGDKEAEKDFSSDELAKILMDIGRIGNFTAKIRESIISIDRALIFFEQICQGNLSKESLVKSRSMRNDLHALSEQAVFVSSEVNFLLSATLGMISNQQNAIIKIFSVAAVILMPPTLVASIYGMNFKIMPELQWEYGYPMAVLMMVIAAILPYRYFKRKGWL